ncbi:MAG: hypothetical protein NZM26_02295 [Patescibacteria group bacterium]|nr:hypothetical protein [Patescibacteria group bacterium]
MSFDGSEIGSHFNPRVVILGENNQEIESHKGNVVIHAPKNQQQNGYDGEQIIYHWIHELAHAINLNDYPRVFYEKEGRRQENILLSYNRYDHKAMVTIERNAHALALKIIRKIRKLYGQHPNISERKYAQLAEYSLHTRQPDNMDFHSAYSNKDRALFREEEIEIRNQTQQNDAIERKNLQLILREEKIITMLAINFGNEQAQRKYEILIENIARKEWYENKIDNHKIISSDTKRKWLADIMRKRGEAWEQFAMLLKADEK